MHKPDPAEAPESAYVRDTYDTLLATLPAGYSAYRWQATPVSRFHYRQSRRALLRALRWVPSTIDRALEIGGGAGAWTPFYIGRVQQLDFLDISEQMLREAKETLARYTNVRYLHEDFLVWRPDQGTYDFVISIRNLEYMDDKRAALRHMQQSLRKDGVLIISTKSPDFDWKGYFREKKLHGGQIGIAALLTLLQESGFDTLAVYPAIMGKKISYAPIRLVWDLLQRILLQVPLWAMPVAVLKYIAESFLIVARRV